MRQVGGAQKDRWEMHEACRWEGHETGGRGTKGQVGGA